jgi:hypothetical protein
MTIEDFRGKQFTYHEHGFPTYVVGSGKDGKTVIHWKGKGNTTVYKDKQVVDFFERGVWILL